MAESAEGRVRRVADSLLPVCDLQTRRGPANKALYPASARCSPSRATKLRESKTTTKGLRICELELLLPSNAFLSFPDGSLCSPPWAASDQRVPKDAQPLEQQTLRSPLPHSERRVLLCQKSKSFDVDLRLGRSSCSPFGRTPLGTQEHALCTPRMDGSLLTSLDRLREAQDC